MGGTALTSQDILTLTGVPFLPSISHELPKQEIIAAFRSSRLFPPPNLVSNYSQRNL